MPFRITSDIPALSNTTPAGQDIYQFESKGFAPPPTSVDTLRHIANTISGEGAFIMQGILRKAADELETAQWTLKAVHAYAEKTHELESYGSVRSDNGSQLLELLKMFEAERTAK